MTLNQRRMGRSRTSLALAAGTAGLALVVGAAFLLKGRQAADEKRAVAEVARKFADLWTSSNGQEAMLALLSNKARESLGKDPAAKFSFPAPAAGTTVTVGEPKITADLAEVSVSRLEPGGKPEAGLLKLRREEGTWRITGISAQLDPDDPATAFFLDFENPAAGLGGLMEGLAGALQQELADAFDKPFQEMFEGKAQPEDRAVDDLRSMDRAEFDRSWKRDLSVNDRAAGDVIAELAHELGMTVNPRAEVQAALSQKISLEMTGRSLFELLEAVCHAAGLHPRYEVAERAFGFGAKGPPPAISLHPGARPFPAVFAGPLLVEIESLREFAPHTIGWLRLRILAARLPLFLEQQLRDKNPMRVLELVDGRGVDLRDAEFDPGVWWPGPANESGVLVLTSKLALKNLLRGAESIARLHGTIAFDLPVEVNAGNFDKLEENATAAAGPAQITLGQVQRHEQTFNDKKKETLSLVTTFKGVPYERVKYVARDAHGQLIHVSGGGGSVDDVGQSYLTISGIPATLVAKVIARVEPVELPFEFTGVPLPAHQQMPESIEPARFDGHEAPATVEVVGIVGDPGFRKVRARVINHSNKPLRRLEGTLRFRDAAGKLLKEDPTNYNNSDLSGEGAALIAHPMSQADIELLAFFMPQETNSVSISLQRVVFADTTDWRPTAAPKP